MRNNNAADYGVTEGDPIDKNAVPIKIVAKDPRFVPMYATEDAAGFDLRLFMEGTPPEASGSDLPGVRIEEGEITILPTGLFMEIMKGYEVQIRPRSGLATKGLTVVNAPGTIDADYRGEIKIIVANISRNPITLHHGERIAQGVLAPVTRARFELVEKLSETDRGTGGLGSTGTH